MRAYVKFCISHGSGDVQRLWQQLSPYYGSYRKAFDYTVERRQLLAHIKEHGGESLRGDSRHIMYVDRQAGRSSAEPRHSGITNNMARKICRDLGIPL
jgi:mRNA interferase HicA